MKPAVPRWAPTSTHYRGGTSGHGCPRPVATPIPRPLVTSRPPDPSFLRVMMDRAVFILCKNCESASEVWVPAQPGPAVSGGGRPGDARGGRRREGRGRRGSLAGAQLGPHWPSVPSAPLLSQVVGRTRRRLFGPVRSSQQRPRARGKGAQARPVSGTNNDRRKRSGNAAHSAQLLQHGRVGAASNAPEPLARRGAC